jgi:amino acid transporter
MAKKKNNDLTLVIVIFVMILALLSMVVLAPGIAITSLINFIIDFERIGPMWGITIIATGGIIYYFYRQDQENFIRTYGITALVTFGVLALLTLFFPDNIFYRTVQHMYSFIF